MIYSCRQVSKQLVRRFAIDWMVHGIGRMTILSGRSGVASRNASFRDGVMAEAMWSPLKLAFELSVGIIAVLLLAWVIDGVFIFKIWPQGIDRLRDILADDLRNGVSLAEQQGSGTGAITGPANFLYGVIFEATGIDDMGRQFGDRSALSIPVGRALPQRTTRRGDCGTIAGAGRRHNAPSL